MMKHVQAGPVAGVAGVIALVVATVSFFIPRSPNLAERVDKYLERVDAQTPAERHRDIAEQVSELEAMTGDKEFAKLPKTKRDAVTDRLAELNAYQAYAAALDKIPLPAAATSNSALKGIQEQLAALKVPVAYQVEWGETDAGMQHRWLRDDAQALERAVADTERAYRRLLAESEQLRNNSEEPDLPGRARKILAEAEKLPSPQADKDKPIPGSKDVTYASVFAFKSVGETYRQWETTHALLKRLSTLKRN